MANTYPLEQMPLPLEPSVIGDATTDQRRRIVSVLALLLLAAADALPEDATDER